MGRPSLTEDQIRDMKIRMIHATQEMISESGLASVSIRNVGQKIGINSATIYRYFRDVDELILFACVGDLQKYVIRLTGSTVEAGDQYNEEFYLLSWQIFCEEAFARPEQYQKLFFSKHSDRLDTIIQEYYKLFPNTLNELPINQYQMYSSSNMITRNLLILRPIIEGYRASGHGGRTVGEETLILINDLTVSHFYSLLMEMLYNDEGITPIQQTERMLQACRYLLHTV